MKQFKIALSKWNISKKILVLISLSLFILGCTMEGNPFDGTAVYDLNLPCYEEWTLRHFEISDENECSGTIKRVSIRKNEKSRLQEILEASNDSCISVTIKYYFLGIKLEKDGFIKNSPSTFFKSKSCK